MKEYPVRMMAVSSATRPLGAFGQPLGSPVGSERVIPTAPETSGPGAVDCPPPNAALSPNAASYPYTAFPYTASPFAASPYVAMSATASSRRSTSDLSVYGARPARTAPVSSMPRTRAHS
jgi:hypothetical protein